ncbi:MAG: phytoene desaturase family protein [Trueperaceae bacterium]|nr:phytoene desaturase family protein [Trueperaceae bacterium]
MSRRGPAPSSAPSEAVDALVLGAGFAGLAAAIELALTGAEVTVVERMGAPGGKAGEVRSAGYRFDTGPSVVTLPEVIAAPFRDAGRAVPLKLRPLDPPARYRFASGRVLDVRRDVEATTAQLSASEARAYRTLLDEARAMYEAAAPTFVHGPHPGPARLLRYGLRHGLRAKPWAKLPDLLARHGAHGELRDLFLRFATYFGADPFQAPAVLHNIAWVELGLGVVAPEGGVAGLVRAYETLARQLGVRFVYGATVTELRPRASAAPEVRVQRDGRAAAYRPTRLVSTLDRDRTLRLLGRRAPGARVTPSLSGLVLLMAVEGRHQDVLHHTLSMPADYAAEFQAIRHGRAPADPALYLSLSCRSEPEDAPPGAENWFVMANAPALDGDGAGIDEEAYARRVEALLVRRGWLREGEGRTLAVLGPRHLAELASRGAIYGAAPHSLAATLRPPQRLRGVRDTVLAGGTVHPGGGIPLAVLSGRRAARTVARRRGRHATGAG